MLNIPKKDREEVKKLIGELESSDFGAVSEEQILERVERLEELFESDGIEALRDYHKRFQRFLGIADEYFSFIGSNGKIKTKREKKRDYTGMSGKGMIRVVGFSDHIFLERVYQGSLKMSWRFNIEGRLDLIDAMLFPQNNVCNLLRVEAYDKEPYDWDLKRAECLPFPEQIDLINPGFALLDSDKKYQPLMRFGHAMAMDLFRNIGFGNIRDNYLLKKGQKQLKEIVKDFGCMNMLKKAGSLFPSKVVMKKDYMIVRYERNPRCVD